VTADIVLVIPVSCGTADRTDTLRHEFGHIINQAAGEGPLGKLPSWLDEGAAVCCQSSVGNNYLQAFDTGVSSRQAHPLQPDGHSIDRRRRREPVLRPGVPHDLYLIEKEGPETFAEFFAAIKRGSRFDQALQQTYGFDLAGFEQEFRAANQLGSSQQQPTTAPTRQPQQSTDPTAAPTRRPGNQAVDDDDDDGGIGVAPLLVGGLAVVFALLAALSFLASQVLSNNRKTVQISAPPVPAPPASVDTAPATDDEWARRPPSAPPGALPPPAEQAAPPEPPAPAEEPEPDHH
jgi:hypothetical protein